MMNSSSEAGKGSTKFNRTCNLLREYLKEKGPLGVTIPAKSSLRTMNLFPTEMQNGDPSPVSNISNVVEEEEHVPKKMTIFYNGKVIVLDDVSSDKANEIMSVAMSLSLSSSPPLPTPRSDTITCDLGQLPQAIARDVSQMRSRSLTRFLEKRKERINGRAPYTLRDKSWLSLSAAPAN